MTRKYEVIRLEKMANDEVIIELKELSDVKEHIVDKGTIQPLYVSGAGAPTYLQKVDAQEQLPETESIPLPENEEEEIIAKQAAAMKKFMPELFPKSHDNIGLTFPSQPLMCFPPKENTILYLTLNEFVSLDLTIGSIVCLDILVYKGDK